MCVNVFTGQGAGMWRIIAPPEIPRSLSAGALGDQPVGAAVLSGCVSRFLESQTFYR